MFLFEGECNILIGIMGMREVIKVYSDLLSVGKRKAMIIIMYRKII